MNEQDVFLAALEIADTAQRTAYIEQACGDDSDLRQQIESLLSAHERSGIFLDVPAVNQLAGVEMTTEQPAYDDELDLSFLEPSVSSDSLGRLGHYEIQEVIGRGGYGIVLKAFDERLHRVVAIKVMAPQLTATSPARKRFLREARATAAIKHENIVHIYSVEEQPLPYLVMEFVEGQTLQHKLDGNGPLELAELLPLARQIASGLAAAHAKGLIHRDVKPVNILLEHGVEPRVKIADFGLARAANDASITRSGLITGTPMFMSPEQARGEALDHRSDLFSLGSVLYQMASGRPPFRAQNALAVLKRVAEETPRPIQEIIPELPDWLCSIIVKLQAKAPEDRFQSAQEVAEILARRRPGLHQDVQPPPLPPSGIDHRNRLIVGMIACCCALLVVIGVSVSVQLLTTDSTKSNAAGNQTVSLADVAPSTDVQNAVPPAGLPNETAATSDEYVQLFNGRDLEGWKRDGNTNAIWTVKDGILTGRWRPNSDFSGGSTIYTRRNDYQNFRFRIEAQLCENWASSMVFCWRDDRPRKSWYRVQIGATSGRDVLETAIVRRSLHSEPIATPDPPVRLKKNQWFTLEVVAERGRVAVYVNDVLRTEFEATLSPSPGHVGIALSGDSTIRIRRIEVRELVDHALLGNSDNGGAYAWPDGTPPPAIAPFNAIQSQEHQNAWARHLGVPVEYVNSLGIKFRLIPPGEFFMGSTPDEINSALPSAGDDLFWQGCIRSEAPRHRVVLTQAIYVSTCEITQAEYQDIMGVNPSWFSATGEGKDRVADIDTSRHPVELVNWNQATEFCVRLSERENLPPVYLRNDDTVEIVSRNGYRLPTEAEWEFACRAGTTSLHWTGEQEERLAEAAWFDGGDEGRPHSVGQLRPNPFGLFDLHGNVNEWVQDLLTPDYYSNFEHTAAVDPLGPKRPGGFRVVRGGDYYYAAADCRSSARYCADPATRPNFTVGFRLTLPTEAVIALAVSKQVE